MPSDGDWSLSPDGHSNPAGKDVMKFVSWVRMQLSQTPKNPDLDEKKINEKEKDIEFECQKMERAAWKAKDFEFNNPDSSNGVALREWREPQKTIKIKMKEIIHPDYWKQTVNSTKPWITHYGIHNPDPLHLLSQYDDFTGNSSSFFTDRPKEIEIDLSVLQQGNRYGFQGQMQAYQIHAVSSVPAINNLISDAEFAERTAKNNHPQDEWQRQLQPDRVQKISEFLDKEDSYLFNEILLHADLDDESLNLKFSKDNKTATLTISYSFLKEIVPGQLYVQMDSATNKDLRPIWIVDGQHRVRGASISERGHLLHFPIFLTISGEDSGKYGLDDGEVAKLFSEINTTAKPLTDEHRYYSGNRFSIPSLKGWNFGPDGESNSTAYELACRLCCDDAGALYNAIRLTPKVGKREEGRIVTTIKPWMGKVSGWLNRFHNGDRERLFQEVKAYYDGFMNVCNDSEDHENGWDPTVIGGGDKNLFRTISPFITTYEVYPHVREMAFFLSGKDNKSTEEKDWLDTGDFERAMEPWSNIPFRNVRLKAALNGRDNDTPKYRKIWLLQFLWASHLGKICDDCSELHISDEKECENCNSDKIINFVTPSREEILSDGISGKLGKGILSAPGKFDLKIQDGSPNLPMTDDITMYLERPWGTIGNPTVSLNGISEGRPIENLDAALSVLPDVQTFPSGNGWMIADLEEGRLRHKQGIQIFIEAARIKDDITRLELKAHFPGAGSKIKDGGTVNFEFNL